MKTRALPFDRIVETIYSLPLEDRMEIKDLLEHNIADSRRNEISGNFKKTQADYKSGKLKFSSKIDELKEML
jgi:hypothetical protein